FKGSLAEFLNQGLLPPPAPPRTLRSGIAPDLDALCIGLLVRDPQKREGYLSVRDCASVSTPLAYSRTTVTAGPRPITNAGFVGRQREIDLLRKGYRRVQEGHPFTAHVYGPSGIGKTVTIREFLEHVRADDRRALVFAGRCHESESVPFKGMDDLM